MTHSLTILLLAFVSGVSAQTRFKADMYVQIVKEDTVICQRQTVLWGFNADTISFVLDRERVFVTEKSQRYYRADEVTGDVVLVLDEIGQRYSVRYLRSGTGFVFWITGIGVRAPHFMISTDNICNLTGEQRR